MKILVANDGSEYSEAAVRSAANIAAMDSAAEFKVVTAIEPYVGIPVEVAAVATDDMLDRTNEMFEEGERLVKASAEALLAAGATVVSHEVLNGSAAREIVEAADEWGADLIIVGTHGRGFWSRTLLGSVSGSVVQHAGCSVLVVRK